MSREEEKSVEPATPPSGWDAWHALSACSPARIGLGRAGSALRTEVHLAFQADHAAARDAVHVPWELEAMREALGDIETCVVSSCAADRASYLLRPDLGRRLDPASEAPLTALAKREGRWDVALVVSDGLSSEALRCHGEPLIRKLLAAFAGRELSVAPVVLVRDGRVALGDPIARALGARVVAIVVGERPGLSASDSLGIYLTLMRDEALSDADRNCISNIHPPGGLGYAEAAHKAVWLVGEALARGYGGVRLKDESPRLSAETVETMETIEPAGE
jgi:ethanolamine ammonia-lyase small subunit